MRSSCAYGPFEAFNCIPHDLLVAKIHAYGFNIDSLKIFFFLFKG